MPDLLELRHAKSIFDKNKPSQFCNNMQKSLSNYRYIAKAKTSYKFL